jgi:uncharacterized membrane protein (DUF2068 family)
VIQKSHFGRFSGYRVIGAYKLVSSIAATLLGIAIFRHLDFSLAEWLGRRASQFRLDPESRFIRALIAFASGLNTRHMAVLGLATFSYAVLHVFEGVGLLMRRRWAAYLTVIATSLLVPIEIFELFRKFRWVKLVVIAGNLVIIAYLAMRLREEKRAWARDERLN